MNNLAVSTANSNSGVRDKPLSFHWRALTPDWRARLVLPSARSTKGQRALDAILLDAFLEAQGLGRWISYSRRRSFYSGQRRYHGSDYTYHTVVPAVDALAGADLLDHEKARAGIAIGWQSRFRASSRLLEAIESPPLVRCDPGELIRLKVNGRLADYPDTARTMRQRRHLEPINEAIGGAALDIEAPGMERDGNVIRFGDHAVYPAKQSLYRVFNDEWNRGGRFYGSWWQNVKHNDRPFITINGEDTVELDYEELHPRLLYRLASKRLEGGAYTLDGWPRKVCKAAFNILLNADTWHAARGAIVKETGLSPERAAQLIEDTKTRHPAVARYFHSGDGLELQYVDAGIAKRVMSNLLKQGIVSLPIHDSFIVQERHQGQLEDAMDTAFEAAA